MNKNEQIKKTMKMTKTEKDKLFKQYIKLDEKVKAIDKKLSLQCFKEIQPFLDRKEFQEAKNYVHNFYRTSVAEQGCFESFEKDMVYYYINRLMTKENDKK